MTKGAVAVGNLSQLPAAGAPIRRLHPHLGTQGGPIRNRADQFDYQPAVGVSVANAVIVREEVATAVPARREQVEESIVVVTHPRTYDGVAEFVYGTASGDFGERAVTMILVKRV